MKTREIGCPGCRRMVEVPNTETVEIPHHTCGMGGVCCWVGRKHKAPLPGEVVGDHRKQLTEMGEKIAKSFVPNDPTKDWDIVGNRTKMDEEIDKRAGGFSFRDFSGRRLKQAFAAVKKAAISAFEVAVIKRAQAVGAKVKDEKTKEAEEVQ